MHRPIQLAADGATETPAAKVRSTVPNSAEKSASELRPLVERPGAEPYDALLWRLCARRDDDGGAAYVVGFTSCNQQSGVSTLTANLAIRAADHGLGPVLIVDANRRRPRLQRLLHVEPQKGLAEVIAGRSAYSACIQPTPVSGLDLLPRGTVDRPQPGHVDPQQIDALVCELRERYSLVFCDLPEVGRLGDSLLLARAMDAALLVVRSERVARSDAQQAVHRLATDGVPLIGAVVTDRHQVVPGWLSRWI